jgi:hypothetical protein
MVTLALALHLALAAAEPAAAPAVPPGTEPAAAPAPDAAAERAAPATAAAVPAASGAGSAGSADLSLAPPQRQPLPSLTLVPPELDRGPYRAREVAGATLGAFAGDALVIGSGYWALQMMASGSIAPTAAHFRHTFYALGIGSLVVPPAMAVLTARLFGGPSAPGGIWKAMLLATAGQAVALAAGYYAAPRFWVVLPVQVLAVSLGTSLGLHWGPHRAERPAAEPAPDEPREVASRPAPATASLVVPLCAGS